MNTRGIARCRGAALPIAIALACTLFTAPASAKISRWRALERAGMRACKTQPKSVRRHACIALQHLTAGGYTMVFQTSQIVRNTWAIVSHDSPSVRRQYAYAAYQDLHAFIGPRHWYGGAEPVPYYTGGQRYYDDNNWVGIDLVTLYGSTHLPGLLNAAKGIFHFQLSGQWRRSDPRDQHFHPGGIYWNTKRRYRNACTQGGAIRLALLLYSETHGARRYLRFATRLYGWTRSTLGTPSGRYRSQIGPGGVISGSAFLSCDGLMVSDGMALYRDTHRTAYRAQAEQTAAAAASQYSLAQIERDDPVFDSMYFSTTQASSRTTLDAYVAYIRKHIAPKTGLVRWRYRFDKFPRRGCIPSFPCRQEQLAQSGIVGAMALWAANGQGGAPGKGR